MMCSAAWPVGLDREICVPSFWGQPRKDPMQIAKLQLVAATSIQSSSGVAQWLACWAHNPKVRGSKPRSANFATSVWILCRCVASVCARMAFVARTVGREERREFRQQVHLQAVSAESLRRRIGFQQFVGQAPVVCPKRGTNLICGGGRGCVRRMCCMKPVWPYAGTIHGDHQAQNFWSVLAKHLWSSGYDVSPTR